MVLPMISEVSRNFGWFQHGEIYDAMFEATAHLQGQRWV